jgi:uncharacterized caspase-like protein
MTKFALLIGVSKYEPGLDALPSAVYDVEAMRQVLVNPEMGDFSDVAVNILQNPSRQEMEDAIYNLFANRQKDDLVVLYFSGHGVVDENGEFYFTSRFTRKEQGKLVPTTAVAARSVRDWLEQSRSQHKVIILDSCFSGAFAKGVKAKDSGSVNPEQFLGGKGTAILTASTSTQYALTQEDFDLSVYTYYLVEGIRTGGADKDDDGFIGIEELHFYARNKVKEAAPAMTPEFYPVKEGYKILLSKSPKDDPRLKYRKQLEQRVHQGTFSIPALRLLNSLRLQLNLSLEVAEEIKAEVLQPYQDYQKKLLEYQKTLVEALQIESPLNKRTIDDLQDYQQHLGLEDTDIELIQNQLFGSSSSQSVAVRQTHITATSSTVEKESSASEIGNTKTNIFGQFTDKSINVIILAQAESRRLGHNFIGTEQILLGLIEEGTGIAAKVLKSYNVNLQSARIEVEKIIGRGSGNPPENIPFTQRAKHMLDLSIQESRQLGHNYIGTEHLILGLTKELGIGAKVLEILGVNLQKLRNSILQGIGELPESTDLKNVYPEQETYQFNGSIFKGFTEKAIKVIMLAQDESRKLGHNFVGSEQILLGLIAEDTGLAAQMLKNNGVDFKATQFDVANIVGRGSGFVAEEIPFTPRAKRILEMSLEISRQLGNNYIRTEHLLLGILRKGDGVAIRILEKQGVNLQKLRNSILLAL